MVCTEQDILQLKNKLAGTLWWTDYVMETLSNLSS